MAERDIRLAGWQEKRRSARSSHLASGTLACPECDAPVLPGRAMSLLERLGCPVCEHAAPVRNFLSLSTPGRPARVDVRVIARFSPAGTP